MSMPIDEAIAHEGLVESTRKPELEDRVAQLEEGSPADEEVKSD